MGGPAVFAGSFDPFTIGHASIARRAADLFGEVVVLVSRNAEKQTLFSESERLEIARAACAADARITVRLCTGLVSEAARELGAACLVKGLRDGADYDYESRLCGILRELDAPEVILFNVHAEYAHVSSGFVRELLRYGKDPLPYVPEGAHAVLRGLCEKKGI